MADKPNLDELQALCDAATLDEEYEYYISQNRNIKGKYYYRTPSIFTKEQAENNAKCDKATREALPALIARAKEADEFEDIIAGYTELEMQTYDCKEHAWIDEENTELKARVRELEAIIVNTKKYEEEHREQRMADYLGQKGKE
jgi:hypothetical protein